MLYKNFDKKIINAPVKLYEKPKIENKDEPKIDHHLSNFSYGG